MRIKSLLLIILPICIISSCRKEEKLSAGEFEICPYNWLLPNKTSATVANQTLTLSSKHYKGIDLSLDFVRMLRGDKNVFDRQSGYEKLFKTEKVCSSRVSIFNMKAENGVEFLYGHESPDGGSFQGISFEKVGGGYFVSFVRKSLTPRMFGNSTVYLGSIDSLGTLTAGYKSGIAIKYNTSADSVFVEVEGDKTINFSGKNLLDYSGRAPIYFGFGINNEGTSVPVEPNTIEIRKFWYKDGSIELTDNFDCYSLHR